MCKRLYLKVFSTIINLKHVFCTFTIFKSRFLIILKGPFAVKGINWSKSTFNLNRKQMLARVKLKSDKNDIENCNYGVWHYHLDYKTTYIYALTVQMFQIPLLHVQRDSKSFTTRGDGGCLQPWPTSWTCLGITSGSFETTMTYPFSTLSTRSWWW